VLQIAEKHPVTVGQPSTSRDDAWQAHAGCVGLEPTRSSRK
jgi:hypothetical protein